MKQDKYRKVEVVDYKEEWPRIFEKESDILKRIFDNNFITVHHIGSTSIPGIKAKPIIDIILVVKDILLVDNCNNLMEEAGYQALGEHGIIGRRFFIKSDSKGERLINAHCYQYGNDEIKRYILFRDYMIANPKEALAYSNLKGKLAQKYPNDIISYMDGKDNFVKAIDKKTGFNGLSLREARTEFDWINYHRIRKNEIFTNMHDGIKYDPNHPSLSDPNNIHYILYLGSDIIGTIQIEYLDNISVIVRLIAIDGNLKNRGYGSKILQIAENMLQSKGYKKILLHSTPKAYNFYKKNGYTEMSFTDQDKLCKDDIDMGKLI